MHWKFLGLVPAVTALWFGSPAVATTLAITGSPSYSISGTNLSYGSSVQNTGSSASADIRMEFWAFPSAYSGGALDGYKLAGLGTGLGPLRAGFIRSESTFGPFTAPPSGTWNLSIVWTEQAGAATNNGYSPRAWANFAPRVFGTGIAPPAVPTGLVTRVISPTEVTLRWNGSTGPSGAAATYKIYSNGSLIGTVTNTGASITNLVPMTTYLYSVSACDALQNCSAQTSAVSAMTFASGTPSVANYTGLWWNDAESGWGMNVSHQGSITFATLFTYDASGAPMWLVMSNGAQQGTSTIFVGDLYRATGPTFNAVPFTPIGEANITRVGTMTLIFANSFSGTLTYSVNGTTVVKNISRQLFGSRAASCIPTMASRMGLTNYQDLWWNPAESGWGINLTHQDDTLFATLFTYDASGKGLWLVMSAGMRQSDGSYFGDLYQTRGPAFNAVPFNPIGASNISKVGDMRLRFTNGMTGTLTYTYNGVSVTKAITRQEFSSPTPGCTS